MRIRHADDTHNEKRLKVKALMPPVLLVAVVVSWFAFLRQTMHPSTFEPMMIAYVVLVGFLFWGVALVSAGRSTSERRFIALLCLVTNLLMALLWQFPWTPRQAFFRDIARVQSRRSRLAQVEQYLGRYHAVYSHQFNGTSGPSARPVPTDYTGSVLYLSDRQDTVFDDFAIIEFRSGLVVDVQTVTD